MQEIKEKLIATHKKYDATAKDLSRVTNRLVRALDVVYNRPGVIFWRGFIRGVGQGLGATIGVAIVFLVLSWLLRQLGGVPALNQWVNSLSQNFPY